MYTSVHPEFEKQELTTDQLDALVEELEWEEFHLALCAEY